MCEGTFVYLDCHDRVPRLNGEQEFSFSQFWRLEVHLGSRCEQGWFLLSLFPWLVDGHLFLHPHMVIPLCVQVLTSFSRMEIVRLD